MGGEDIILSSLASDVQINSWNKIADITDAGVRTLINGVGTNAGDPNSAGNWNNNGYEGVHVLDTTNGKIYIFRNGTWYLLN